MHRNIETSVEISENSSIELMDVEGKKITACIQNMPYFAPQLYSYLEYANVYLQVVLRHLLSSSLGR